MADARLRQIKIKSGVLKRFAHAIIITSLIDVCD